MKKQRRWGTILKALMAACFIITTSQAKVYETQSPNGKLHLSVDDSDGTLQLLLRHGDEVLLKPSTIAIELDGGKVWGRNARLLRQQRKSQRETVKALFYGKEKVENNYNELTLTFREGFSLQLRAFDQGAAYRFVSLSNEELKVVNEQADFNFPDGATAYFPYVRQEGTSLEEQLINTFENTYTHTEVARSDEGKLAFLPVLIEPTGHFKIGITEANVRHYPNMLLHREKNRTSLSTYFARYPIKEEQGGYDNLQLLVKERGNFMALCPAKMQFPWRVMCVGETDTDLLVNDLVYCLAEPCQLETTDWIKPGKVAWDWWNNWGVYNVPFKAGINTETYLYFINFAARYGIEYVVLDDGWSVRGPADLLKVVDDINLKKIIDYANSKNVGIILWAGSYALDRDLENVCKTYAAMGAKGFKVDVINRDDQKAVDYHYRVAEMAAKYGLVVDFHGTFKPSGLNRTYPNVLNFEGVCGMEFNKWSKLEEYDQMNGDVTIPFVRMLAGPMDYTQGAMLNGTQSSYRSSGTEPMSQGTRTHQLALYTVLMSPLSMLCDSPTHYEQNEACTRFISGVPTCWDETVPLCGKVGEYVAMARRKGSQWYVGALTNWTAREIELDLSVIGAGGRQAEVFRDGPNAEKIAQDYEHLTIDIPADGKLRIKMAPGGGYTLKFGK